MTNLQEQSRALGDPTRHALFRYVAERERPVGVAELTERFGFNHNAIRQHLAKLVDAHLLVETKAPTAGRGRPRFEYALDPTADSRWGVIGPYERLSMWLAEVVRTGDVPVEVGRRVGRHQRPTHPMEGDPIDQLVEVTAHNGFDPVARRRGTTVDVTLRSCPFESAARSAPETVCELHLGIAYGIAENIEGLEVDELVRQDPRRAHCRLRCHVEPAS